MTDRGSGKSVRRGMMRIDGGGRGGSKGWV